VSMKGVLCVCVCERERVCVCKCVCERECVYVCMRMHVRVHLCVQERERHLHIDLLASVSLSPVVQTDDYVQLFGGGHLRLERECFLTHFEIQTTLVHLHR